ncbi:MAG: hypothetical protein IJC27_04345 [Lentisphaeria bacterium]|nr:hypothetical protein [Lentisphaeria bacterium]
MKKIFVLLLIFCGFPLFASEDAVKQVLKDMEKFQLEMNGSAMLELYHPAYVEIDLEGNKTAYSQIKDNMQELDAMRQVIMKATLPDASLLEIVSAVFVMNESEMTPELRETINSLEDNAEGRKLAVESAKTLSEIHRIYLEAVRELWAGCEVISVKVDKDLAQLVYKMKESGSDRINEYTLELEKVNGKWLIKKSVCK